MESVNSVVHQLIPEVIGECALWTGVAQGCPSDEAIASIKEVFDLSDSLDAAATMEQAKEATKCDTETCVLKDKRVASKVNMAEELTRLKYEGPTDDKLLSNVNIDGVLGQWRRKYKMFFPYNFNMLDYKSHCFRNGRVENTPDTLHTINTAQLRDKGITLAACVVNSDKYIGNGKHWMALVVDFKGKTIEFFNSGGNPPNVAWVDWMVKTRNELGDDHELVKVSSIRHQRSKTECGVYSLFYIWSRLNGIPAAFFIKNPISDNHMFHFRQHLFAGKPGTWDWKEYQKRVAIKWESGAAAPEY